MKFCAARRALWAGQDQRMAKHEGITANINSAKNFWHVSEAKMARTLCWSFLNFVFANALSLACFVRISSLSCNVRRSAPNFIWQKGFVRPLSHALRFFILRVYISIVTDVTLRWYVRAELNPSGIVSIRTILDISGVIDVLESSLVSPFLKNMCDSSAFAPEHDIRATSSKGIMSITSSPPGWQKNIFVSDITNFFACHVL
jgi:hypothetical protein